jgi:hypothetical protein
MKSAVVKLPKPDVLLDDEVPLVDPVEVEGIADTEASLPTSEEIGLVILIDKMARQKSSQLRRKVSERLDGRACAVKLRIFRS